MNDDEIRRNLGFEDGVEEELDRLTSPPPDPFPKKTKFYTHSSKESNYEQGEELGLSESSLAKFVYAGYELTIDIEVEENGEAYATHFEGVELPRKVKIT